jgi:NADH:ubiquinone oxidoreductase subunit E
MSHGLQQLHRRGGAAGDHSDVPHEPVLVGPVRDQLDRLIARYPTKQSCLLPALWLVQESRGWISEGSIGEVAAALDLTPAYVKGVVTFYTMYHTHPVGRHFIQVCTTSRSAGPKTPCELS